ncbi:MAG TPA: M56 family metallopeptidase [Longimicrobium sp.]|nr:M56 family metallopeptidase [Longimicrobium sp.]
MIAHWMLYCLATGLLLSLAALAMERAMRAFVLPQRWVWAAAMVLMLTLPAAARWLPRAEISIAAAPVAMDETTQPMTMAASPAAATESGPRVDIAALDRPLTLGWMGLTAAALLAFAGAWAVLERRRRRWRAAEVDGVPVLLSPSTGPAVIGLFRSRIVLPRWVVEDAPADVRALLMEHEREHLRAGDPRLLALGLAAVALMPWNPAAWWQLRRLRLAVEVDCDARVLARRADVRAYGTLLLEVGRRGTGGRLLAIAFSEPQSFLERRIRMMTSPRARRPLAAAAGFGGLAALLIAAACRAPEPARAAGLELTPREAVQRLYPQVARGTGDSTTVVLSFAPTGKLASHQMTVRGQRAGGPIPAALREGGRLEMHQFAAGDLGPDPVRVFVLRQMTPEQRHAAEAGVTDTVIVPATASPGDTVRPVLVNGAALTRALQREYPPALRDAGLRGSAEVRFRVTEQGIPADLRALRASHPAFADAAVRALANARFRPARVDGSAVPYTLTLPVQFQLDDDGWPVIAASAVPPQVGEWDQPPVPLNTDQIARALTAEYPPLLRDAGITARAQVRIKVAATGEVTSVEALSSTHPEAGPAAERALLQARFRPARKDGRPLAAEMVMPVEFRVPAAGES